MALVVIVAVLAVVIIAAATVVMVRGRRRSVLDDIGPPPRVPETHEPTPDAVVETIEAPAVDEVVAPLAPDEVLVEPAPAELVEPEVIVRPTFRDRLSAARGFLAGYVGTLLSRSAVDDETWDELEEALLLADVGVDATTELIDSLRERAASGELTDPEQVLAQLKIDLRERLGGVDRGLRLDSEAAPNVWLFVGVNGVGKTTTIGKVGRRLASDERVVVMAAGDTFRAAAAEQLEMWAERVGADIVRGQEGGDPSSVVFDAVQRANARGADVVLADTAGRLHTKVNLMEELTKVRRVADRDPGTVTEVLLVIDATTGQNGLIQAQQFTEAVDVSGVVLTKLDGSAKGGIVFAIQDRLGIPVKLVGLGEGPDDLVDFDENEFVAALFD